MEEIEFNYQDVNIDTLLIMREELEKELETYDDEDIEDLKKAIELINTMCYYKIKKDQDEKEQVLTKKIEEIKLSKL